MTAPARVGGPASRTRTRTQPPHTQPRERTTGKPPAAQPERATGTRGRSPAAERAYARRAQRTGRGLVSPAEHVERKPGSASRATFVVAVMALLVGGVVATLWFSTQATADAYRLEQAKNTTNQLQVQVGQLQQRVAQQDSPPSLVARARQLGMIPAPDAAHLVVGANGKVRVVGTPTVAEPPPKPTTKPATPMSTPPAKSTSTPPATAANPSAGG